MPSSFPVGKSPIWKCSVTLKEKKIVKEGGISHTAVRDILREYGIEWRHSKTVLSSSRSRYPEYDLKKAYWGAEEQYIYNR